MVVKDVILHKLGADRGTDITISVIEQLCKEDPAWFDIGMRAIADILGKPRPGEMVRGLRGQWLAAWNDHLEVAQWLLSKGAPLDIKPLESFQ